MWRLNERGFSDVGGKVRSYFNVILVKQIFFFFVRKLLGSFELGGHMNGYIVNGSFWLQGSSRKLL